MFAGTAVLGAGVAAAAPGDVLYRVNAGGPQLAATDGGPAWTADTGEDTSQYHNPTGSLSEYSVSQTDGSVPASTPTDVFASARWDDSGGEELQWEFPVSSAGTYEVRLYFADGYADSAGQREFDVSVEGDLVLDNYDIVDDVGQNVGTMKSFTTTVDDGTLDVDFAHAGANNPIISAIEIVEAGSSPDELGTSTSSVDFGEVLTGETGTETVTLSNLGGSGDPTIEITDVSVSGDGAFSVGSASQTTLAPGESTTVEVSYAPSSIGDSSGTLEVDHTGTNSPVTVALSGTGTNDVDVGFESDSLGANVDNPTDLQFGPDGRLYVAQQKGVIKAFEVERQGEEDYVVTNTETITAINDLQNHNDDGSTDGVPGDRQVTGMLVTGSADDVVIYVTSSDPRSRSSPVSDRSDALDTNSGVLSKLTQDGSSWNHVALVRGLPRSTEKHSTNDLIMQESTGNLLISQGGNSGAGAPNDEFTFTPEYAYSAAVLSVDVGPIESMSTKTDTGNVPYKYDLPTLDPSVSQAPDGTPFGGMGGQNMAIWESSSPVQVYASGLRNSYDLTMTEDGTVYATDNGVGGGWGAPPVNEGPDGNCLNQPVSEGNPEDEDQIHLIEEDGYYGHPNPTRGNPDGAGLYKAQSGGAQIGADDILANAVPSANPVECDYQEPGSEDGAVETFGMSTNGIHEYTASNFGGKMRGDLLAAGLNGPVFRVQLNSDGTSSTETSEIFTGGAAPLDIEAQGDDDQFPGTVWVAEYGNGIKIYEPNDYDGSTICDPSDPSGDADGDGFTNGDEQAVGTDPCSAASQPGDWDGDNEPNALDDDDDNDGLLDTEDPFALDPDNGATTQVVTDCPMDPEDAAETCLTFNSNDGFDRTSLFGLGFTGVMTNGQDDYADLYDRSKIQAGGAADIFGIEEVTGDGSAYEGDDDQRQGFQFGMAPPDEPFVIHGEITNGFNGEVPPEYWNYGIFLGTGTQADYTKLVIGSDGGNGGEIEYAVEEGNSATGTQIPEDGVVGNTVDLYITVDPTTDPASVTYEYAIDGGERIEAGTSTIPSSWVSGDSMAVGLIPTATGASGTYSANYNELEVELVRESSAADPEASVSITPNGGVDASSYSNDGFQVENTGDVAITSVSIDTSTAVLPDLVYDPAGTAGDGGDKSFQLAAGSDDVGVVSTADADLFDKSKNGQDSEDGYQRLTVGFDDFQPGETLLFGSDGDPTSIKGAGSAQQTEAGPVSGAELAGSTVTVEFANGETTTVRTFGDGSAGGSAAVTSADQSTQPTLGVQNVQLDSNALDARHSAATVSDAQQTVTVSGPAGATVQVMQADTELNLVDVPEYDGTSGYEIEEFEGNNFVDVSYQTVTLDSNGEASVQVDVPSENLLYLLAAVKNDDGTTGAPSNVVVLEHEADTGGDTPTDGEVVYRTNVGGPQLPAIDGGMAWEADTNGDPSQYRTSAGSDDSDTSGPDGDAITIQDIVPDSTPTDLYQSTRYDPDTGSEMQWGFPVQSGETYEVRVYVAETYIDSSYSDEPREYGVAIEGGTVLENYNMYQELGHDVGSVKTFEVTPSDDTLNVEFLHGSENPMIAGLEVVQLSDGGGGNAAPTVDPIDDRTVTEGDSAIVPIVASDDDGDSVSLSVNGPEFVSLSNGELTIAPQSGDAANSPYTVEVVADDGTDQTVESFQVTVDPADTSTDGEVAYRVNVGGPEVAGTPAWAQDEDGSPSQHLVTTDTQFSEYGGAVTEKSDTVSEDVPLDVYNSARFIDTGGQQTSQSMDWEFDVQQGATYEVRLYFAEPYFGGSGPAQEGARQFHVDIEGQRELENYDIYADVGFGTGTVKTFEVTPSDGTLDVDLVDGAANNPIAGGIEVVRTSDAEATPEASIAVTPNSGVDATTWDNNAYQIENTGDVAITSVSIDTSTAVLPDLVFDPYGTAGDGGDKSFQAGSNSDDVGLVSTADADIFGQPHNDAAGDDGFERMTLTFDDFQSGETLTFGSDGDPTSIKGAGNDVQSTLAGPVSGAELAGATVTVEFADGTTETVRTFGDGSAGGSAAVTSADQSTQPTLGLEGGSLDASALDARHSAATVTETDQTLTVSGPAGATVQVMQATTELNLQGVPDYDGTPGYEVEAYEGNNFLGVTYQTVTLDASGTATVDVAVPDADGQQLYVMAAIENADGSTGVPSNVVVFEQGDSAEGPGPIGDFENAPTDPDGDGVYEDVNGNGEFGLVDVQAFFQNYEDPVVQSNVDAFDFNDNGEVNLVDVQALFQEAS
ncbi:malectin domain-containing carbohydrate-binding protein [Salinirubellus litoreus]